MITGRPLAVEQCRKLDQLIADYNSGRDKAGLENLDLECCAYGILCPTRDQRLAALQAQWDIQVLTCIPTHTTLQSTCQLGTRSVTSLSVPEGSLHIRPFYLEVPLDLLY